MKRVILSQMKDISRLVIFCPNTNRRQGGWKEYRPFEGKMDKFNSVSKGIVTAPEPATVC